jgi:coenzyme PQQ precursor peptide PqqA
MLWRMLMAWSKPKIVEICVGLEINAYYPAEL